MNIDNDPFRIFLVGILVFSAWPVMSRKQPEFPNSLPPRGLSRDLASRYIGISVSKFDQLVEEGRMPAAKRIDSRKLWDRDALDTAFWALPEDGPDPQDNPWDAAA